MKRYWPVFLLICRLLVGGLFLYAGASKGLDPRAFAGEVAAYKILPYSLNLLVAASLPWLEIICGGLLLAGRKVPATALILLGLEVTFAVFITLAISRGLTISCGCFGSSGGSSLPFALLRDLLLIALTIPLLWCHQESGDKSDD